jgi:hypothetical protein
MKIGGDPFQSMTALSLLPKTTKKSKSSSKSSTVNYEEFYNKYNIPIDVRLSIGTDDDKFKILANEIYKKMSNHYKELSKNPYDRQL